MLVAHGVEFQKSFDSACNSVTFLLRDVEFEKNIKCSEESASSEEERMPDPRRRLITFELVMMQIFLFTEKEHLDAIKYFCCRDSTKELPPDDAAACKRHQAGKSGCGE